MATGDWITYKKIVKTFTDAGRYCVRVLTLTSDIGSPDWATFISTYWEKDPVLMASGFGDEPLTLDTLFAAITSMPARGPSDRFWLAARAPVRSRQDFRRLNLDLIGPQSSDQGFDGFFDRMGSHSYGINIHGLGKADARYDDLKEVFAGALHGAPGPVPLRWQSDTFFGNYRATPFGIHRDPAGVFSFTLKGHRSYYTWPAATFEPDHPDLFNPDPDVIDKHLATAERIDVRPGQVVYWPSNRWHLVASSGDPFVVAQVSAYFAASDVGQ